MFPEPGQRIEDSSPGVRRETGEREASPEAERETRPALEPGQEDQAASPPGRPRRIRTGAAARTALGAILAAAAGALLAVGGVAAGVFEPLACAVAEVACPPGPGRGEIPALRPLNGVEAATAGRYVGLGDSYSSGEGAFDEQDEKEPLDSGATQCRRSRGSYVPTVGGAYRFAAGMEFWACGGATTGNALRGQYGQPPQVERIGPEVSLVTITMGGNDAGFTPVLKNCLARASWSAGCVEQEPEVRRRIAQLGRDLYEVLAEIHRRAPQARVIVVGYPRPFPRSPGGELRGLGPVPAATLSTEDQLWLNRMTRLLDDEIARVATGVDRLITAFRGQGSVEYIDAYDAFDGHEIGTARPYLHGLVLDFDVPPVNPHSFHPNRDGYRRLGELVRQRIEAGPGRPLHNYRVETR